MVVDGPVSGDLQEVLPRQTQRPQAAVAANARTLCAQGRLSYGESCSRPVSMCVYVLVDDSPTFPRSVMSTLHVQSMRLCVLVDDRLTFPRLMHLHSVME